MFSRQGYTQLIAYGTLDNTLEESLSQREDKLPQVLEALDKAAANGISTDLEKEVFNNLICYCSYLWSISPFAKAVAPLEYVMQLDLDLKNGRTDLLKLASISRARPL